MMKATNRVIQYPDGKYRWVYEVHMLKNPSILFDVYKVLGISAFIVAALMLVIQIFDGDLSPEALWGVCQVFLVVALIMLVLGFIGYIILAWQYGWKYLILFTLDEKEVVHQQMPGQVKKAQLLSALTALAGAAAGSPGAVGTGILAASRTSSISTLANVERLIPQRRFHLIKVNQMLNKNRVYVPDEDFDFVYTFLCQHCIRAKIKG